MVALEKKDKVILIFLFLFSLLIRAVVFEAYLSKNQNFWQVDSTTYHLIAHSVADGKGISQASGAPNFYRLPGYPVFIGFFYKLFGADQQNVLWAQVLLGSFIPLLIFFLAVALFPRRRWLAWMAAWYSAVHLGLVLYSGFFMSETLFIFLFLLFCIYFFRAAHLWFCNQRPEKEKILDCAFDSDSLSYLPDPMTASPEFTQFYGYIHMHGKRARCELTQHDITIRNLFFAGLFLGLASLVRPVGHYLVALSLLVVLCTVGAWRQKLQRASVLLFAWFIPVSFWLVRNYLLLGSVFFHTLPGGHFLNFSASRVIMQSEDIAYVHARVRVNHAVHTRVKEQEQQRGRALNEIERCRIMGSLACEYFMQYPWITLKLWMTDIFRTALSLYSAELLYLNSGRPDFDYFDKERTPWSLVERYLNPHTDNTFLKAIIWSEILFFFLMLVGILIGLLRLLIALVRRKNDWADFCSWSRTLPYIALFIVIGLAGGYARMRLPAEPFLMVLSLCGWAGLLSKKH